MLLAFPLATSTELAEVLRPGGRLRADSALRTLRDNGLAAEAVSVVPRSSHGAKGRAVWYSSLMLDVARLLRAHDLDAARTVHDAATELAGHRSARTIAEALVNAGPDPSPHGLDAETGGALTRLALLTASRRNELGPLLHVDRFVGRVMAVKSGTAHVRADDDGVIALFPSASMRGVVGDAIAVDSERMTSVTLMWIRPAFASDDDPHGRVLGGPRLLSDEVTATSKDGQTGTASITYTVIGRH